MKVGMLGGRTSILGFRALGVDTFTVPRPQDAPEVFGRIELSDYAVLFITEPVYEVLKEDLASLEGRPLPVVTVIPAVTSTGGVGLSELKALVERAVGTDVLMR